MGERCSDAPELCSLLIDRSRHDSSPYVRTAALEILVELFGESEDTKETLRISAAEDEDEQVRGVAVLSWASRDRVG